MVESYIMHPVDVNRLVYLVEKKGKVVDVLEMNGFLFPHSTQVNLPDGLKPHVRLAFRVYPAGHSSDPRRGKRTVGNLLSRGYTVSYKSPADPGYKSSYLQNNSKP